MSANSQSAYRLEIAAKTGDRTSAGNTIAALGQGPSINNSGDVAFIVQIQNARLAIWVKNGETLLRNYALPLGPEQVVDRSVSINDNRHVLWHFEDTRPLSGDTTLIRYEDGDADPIIGQGSDFFTNTRFEYVLPGGTMNNKGRGVFCADLKTGGTVLAARANGSDSHDISEALSGLPKMYPMIADNNRVVVSWGSQSASPLYLFLDAAFNTAEVFANSASYLALGQKPGISDDGAVVGFMGHHRTVGIGIFAWFDFHRFKIAGLDRDGILDPGETWSDSNQNGRLDPGEDRGFFSSFSLIPRVGVNRVRAGIENQSMLPILLRAPRRRRTSSDPWDCT